MGTLLPSPTLISFSTPAGGEGISASTLSVEISKSGSSRSTLSPGFLSHLVIVPSKMLSPIWGITMSTAILRSPLNLLDRRAQPDWLCHKNPIPGLVARQLLCSGKNLLGVRKKIVFQCRRVRHRRIERSDAHERTVQIAKSFFAKDGGNFAGDAAGFGVFVDDQDFVGFFHGL